MLKPRLEGMARGFLAIDKYDPQGYLIKNYVIPFIEKLANWPEKKAEEDK